MNTKLLISCLLFITVVFGQHPTTGQLSLTLPSLSPQSPNTASLGKYGEVDVNESTGLISPSISLFKYEAGKITIPISLQYDGNGVQVNQEPTLAGINWNINNIGIITRVVNGRADELTTTNNRVYLSQQELNNLSGVGVYGSQWYNQLYGFNNSNSDSEVDVFNYNFFGYSGSFYLDKNNIVHLIKYDKELEITFLLGANNKSQFTVKSPQGDYYYFGGPDASESSRTLTNGPSFYNNSPFTQNAFYLYQISFNKGGAVYFDYESYGGNNCNNKIAITETAILKSTSQCDRNLVEIFSQVESLVKIKKIRNSFNNQIVNFETSTVNQCAGIYKLNSVSLVSSDNNLETTLKKIKLDYLTLNVETDVTKNKFFLQKVSFFDRNNQFVNKYDLSYNDLNLIPKKFSFAQDELGYFNGVTSNTTLLPYLFENPLIETTYFSDESTICGTLANREAFLSFARVGSLTKIAYPTGGNSEFEYELPYKGKKQLYINYNVNAIAAPAGSGYVPSPSYTFGTSTIYNEEFYPDGGDGPLNVTQAVRIKAVLNTTLIGSFTNQNKVSIYVTKLSLNGTSQEFLIGEYGNFPTNGGSTSQPFNYILQPGSYKFRLAIHKYSSGISNVILANVYLKLPNGFRDAFFPGLRIKKIKSFTSLNDVKPNIKRYFYNSVDNISNESYEFSPNYLTKNITYRPDYTAIDPTTGSFIYYPTYEYTNLNSSSTRDIYPGANFIYTKVTVSFGGDNFENGGKGMSFYSNPTQSTSQYNLGNYEILGYPFNFTTFVNSSSNSLSSLNSVLEYECFYNSSKFRISETKYNYDSTSNSLISNVKTYKFVLNTSFMQDYIYLLYDIKSLNQKLMSTVSKQFFYNTNNTQIVNTTTNTYTTDKVSLPSSVETTNSLNQVTKTNIYYKSDLNLSQPEFGALSTQDIARVPLSDVIKTESFSNNVLLDTKQVLFKNFSGNVLPNIVKAKKGNNATTALEDRIVFDNYDFYGNPTSVLQKDGSKTRYIYNNNQQVILKIEDNNSGVTIDDGVNTINPCYYQQTYPSAMITVYNYDSVTNNLINIIDPKCDKTTYTYDTFGRLQSVKDKDGNTLSENQYNYKQ